MKSEATRISLLPLILTLLLLTPICHAEEGSLQANPDIRRPYWLNVGIGGAFKAGFAGGASYSHIVFGGLGTLRLFSFFAPADGYVHANSGITGDRQLESATDVGLLFGQRMEHAWGHVSVAAGLGWTWGETEQTGEWMGWHSTHREDFSTWSIPLESQLFFTMATPHGIGVSAFGNLNPEKSFAGLLLCLQLR